ncbi:MAG: manganese efflux pump [Gammaproteobacteria bacterium]|nr:MAG: manganese efflux pump [Gammaproteobacteria bacterium]
MSLIEITAVAVALAMDAFAVSIAAGVTLRRASRRQTFRLSWHFGLFQALMPIIGYGAGLTVQELIASFDHWVAFGLLVIIGGRMIVGAIRDDEEQVKDTEPTRGWSLVMLSVATSVDALAVGLSLAMLGISVWFPALVIGIVAGLFTAGGIHLGGYVGLRLGIARYATLFGGVVLLIIGGRILSEHGVF